jgi:hypothetical protein
VSFFDLEAMRSRNRLDAGSPFLAIVKGDELLLIAPEPTDDGADRFGDEGNDPYEEVIDHVA